jgi:aryl-alcohol dehydrogenase
MLIDAAVIDAAGGPFVPRQLEIDACRADEVLVRVVGVGICHTDLVMRDGILPTEFPIVLGHEGAGVVEAVGVGVRAVQPGDHVVLSFYSCGDCRPCRSAAPAYCAQFITGNFSGGRVSGGSAYSGITGHFFQQSAFASHALANIRNIVKVRRDAPLAVLGPLGCGIQTGAGAVINALNCPAGSTIAIFGAGSVGLSAVLAARLVGCARIIAIDKLSKRLDLARDLGATDVVEADDHVLDAIKHIFPDGVDFSIEATGQPSVFRQAIDAVAPLGTCGLVGLAPPGTETPLDMWNLLSGRRVIGITEGSAVPQTFIPMLIDLFMDGRFSFDRMIRRYPFSKIGEAVDDMMSGATVKAVLDVGVQ